MFYALIAICIAAVGVALWASLSAAAGRVAAADVAAIRNRARDNGGRYLGADRHGATTIARR